MSTLPVIAAADGSPDSDRALRWAAGEARRRGVPLDVVHIWPYVTKMQPVTPDAVVPVGVPKEGEDPVLNAARELVASLPDGPPELRLRTIGGDPGHDLPELGAEAALLVLGSRGRGGFASLLLGSNGLACAARAASPVVVVPRPGDDDARGEGPYGRVTLGLAPSPEANAATGYAFEAAARSGSKLQVVSGYPEPVTLASAYEFVLPYERETAEFAASLKHEVSVHLAPHRERHPEVEVEVRVEPGDAAGQLVDASRDADLVVVARRRRRLTIGHHLGSVAHAVLLHSACPVAVVPDSD
ncbi:universal stress protein [Streptomyces sp. NPDC050617]|uniref:universal stress protein n=1 Tax=Streptomyces sp. NPDC050617 TaxID=3154628 RepID=UPI00342E4F87